ncbi:hypothetical protein QCA50_004607 [Cerrena zonata]|uniref:Uncharacterized protein n=1 Tax=Cerrena zonata TaxID=2478898 RepID=A0AAW0GK12_9APHY
MAGSTRKLQIAGTHFIIYMSVGLRGCIVYHVRFPVGPTIGLNLKHGVTRVTGLSCDSARPTCAFISADLRRPPIETPGGRCSLSNSNPSSIGKRPADLQESTGLR